MTRNQDPELRKRGDVPPHKAHGCLLLPVYKVEVEDAGGPFIPLVELMYSGRICQVELNLGPSELSRG